MSFFNVSPNRGFGFQQYINFGKHKGKTYYDVANAGDYKYLKWCLQSGQAAVKDPRSFFISDTCMPHIRSALLTENLNVTPWTKQISQENNDGRCICVYTAQDMKEPDSSYSSPDIEMKRCPNCNIIKTYLLFDLGNHDKCRKCYTTTFNRMEEKPISEAEYKKGGPESYKGGQVLRRRTTLPKSKYLQPVKEIQDF